MKKTVRGLFGISEARAQPSTCLSDAWCWPPVAQAAAASPPSQAEEDAEYNTTAPFPKAAPDLELQANLLFKVN